MEYDSHTVRYINVDTSQVTTVAGVGRTSGYRDGEGTQALFRNPYGLTVDVSRTVPIVYVTEIGPDNHYVRSVDMTTVMVQTVAESALRRSSGDGMGQWSTAQQPAGCGL